MKHILFLLSSVLLLAVLPARAQLHPISDKVTAITFEDCKAFIVPDTISGFEDFEMNAGSGVRCAGPELTFYNNETPIRIHLRPNTIERFRVTDNAELTFQGSFLFPQKIDLFVDDASTVNFESSTDSLFAKEIFFDLQDAARVYAKNRLITDRYQFHAQDNSRLSAFIVQLTGEEDIQNSHSSTSDNAKINIYMTIHPGQNTEIDTDKADLLFAKDDDDDDDDDDIEFNINDLEDLDADEIVDLARKIRLRLGRRTWHTNIDFAWGFHNWSKDRFNGLAGTEDDAAVRTSMNHTLLTINYPIVYSRRVALYAGFGLEWDKYKFHRGDIHFDNTTQPYHLIDGFLPNSESRLLTRYVIVPITIKFDLGRHWKLELAAIPGLHWSGSHTGLRRDITSGDNETNIKDYTVNPYIAPYKLDARVSVKYRVFGLYFQTSMLSAFKGSCEELFPVKFGIIL